MLLAYLLNVFCDCYSLVIVIYVLMSWIPRSAEGVIADVDRFLGKLCDPYLNLFKKIIPPIGGMLDVSPIVALLVLQLAVRFITSLIR